MDISPNAPISLDEAAKICLRGLVKASTLRRAADRGELAIERLGRRIVTTPADVNAWREACREKARERDCGSGQSAAALMGQSGSPAGSSSMEQSKLARGSALAKAERLKSGLRPISPPNTSHPGGSVHFLKS